MCTNVTSFTISIVLPFFSLNHTNKTLIALLTKSKRTPYFVLVINKISSTGPLNAIKIYSAHINVRLSSFTESTCLNQKECQRKKRMLRDVQAETISSGCKNGITSTKKN